MANGQTSGNITFRGKSGERYSFQSWDLGTKFKAVGGVYVVTRRTYEDKTFATKASHHTLAIGQTADLSVPLFTKGEDTRLVTQGANCICVLAVPDEARRAEIESDLLEGNAGAGMQLRYLFQTTRP